MLTTIQDAVDTIVKYVRNTGKQRADAVKELWDSLGDFSEDEARVLMQQALSARAGAVLTNPFRSVAAIDDSERIESYVERGADVTVCVQPYRHFTMERHEVTCQILYDTVYLVNGVSKPFATFTLSEAGEKAAQYRRVEASMDRHARLWEYVHERLTKLKKIKVEDLAEGEQTKIARMLYDVKTQSEPLTEIAS